MNLHFYIFIFSRFQNFCLIAQILRTFFITYAILTPSFEDWLTIVMPTTTIIKKATTPIINNLFFFIIYAT